MNTDTPPPALLAALAKNGIDPSRLRSHGKGRFSVQISRDQAAAIASDRIAPQPPDLIILHEDEGCTIAADNRTALARHLESFLTEPTLKFSDEASHFAYLASGLYNRCCQLERTLRGEEQAAASAPVASHAMAEAEKPQAARTVPPPDIAAAQEKPAASPPTLAMKRHLQWRYATGETIIGFLPSNPRIGIFSIDPLYGSTLYELSGVPFEDGGFAQHDSILEAQTAAEIALADWFGKTAPDLGFAKLAAN